MLEKHQPSAIVHFAAESHVDRSIRGPDDFIRTNVDGTFALLEETRAYWAGMNDGEKADFRFLHVSTDEVYGSLGPHDPQFSEATQYAPNSPYAASKAASDHLVRAYHHTYGLPTLTTNCSNNYGPFQFPEKLIPLMVSNAFEDKPLPVYGDGQQVRDWLYVEDHCRAINAVLDKGGAGEIYNIGGNCSLPNLEVVRRVLEATGKPHSLITRVMDRPGHDRRYALTNSKLTRETGWQPRVDFEHGLRDTVDWYQRNRAWVERIKSGEYRRFYELNYSQRAI